jgi:succinyl-CoA synthetase beta subunit
MKIHEYQAKKLLAEAGALVPKGVVIGSVAEAEKAFDQVARGVAVIKSQLHAGGRGKGRFKNSGKDFGGVRVVKSTQECRETAEVYFKYPLVTKQTGPEGRMVFKALVEEPSDIARELYAAVVIDRAAGLPVLMASREGGMDIEEVAAKQPEAILKAHIDPDRGLEPHQARRLCYDLGLTEEQIPKAEKLLTALGRVFLDKDCSLAEINPLVVTKQGEVMALDAKMTFDDNALFRHPEIEELRDMSEENPSELRAGKAGLSFVSLHGNIGCLVNGAGLAMSTMDIIKLHGGEPANFLDVGGGANKEQVTEAFRILLSDPEVKAVLVNIFGGIMKCDIIAGAIIAAAKEVGFKVPLVVRLEGTNVEIGRKMLTESGLAITTATDLTDAAKKVVAAAR